MRMPRIALFILPSFACRHNIDRGVKLKVRGQLKSEGAGGIEMPKFEKKKGNFAKVFQKLGEVRPIKDL